MTNDGEQTNRPLYGILAEFENTTNLLDTSQALRKRGFKNVEAYTPFQVEGLSAMSDQSRSWIPFWSLVGGCFGAVLAFALQMFAATIDYPYQVAGRAFASWPAFIPITFEVTILSSAIFTVVALLVGMRLPKAYHPVLEASIFQDRNESSYFLLIRADDRIFDPLLVNQIFRNGNAVQVEQVRV